MSWQKVLHMSKNARSLEHYGIFNIVNLNDLDREKPIEVRLALELEGGDTYITIFQEGCYYLHELIINSREVAIEVYKVEDFCVYLVDTFPSVSFEIDPNNSVAIRQRLGNRGIESVIRSEENSTLGQASSVEEYDVPKVLNEPYENCEDAELYLEVFSKGGFKRGLNFSLYDGNVQGHRIVLSLKDVRDLHRILGKWLG